MYRENNIFHKIIKGEIECKKLFESEETLVFFDINPVNKTHLLVIPKGLYDDWLDFHQRATEKEIKNMFFVLKKLQSNLSNSTITTNSGKHQEIPHFHVHFISSSELSKEINWN
jgi:histidine triad (HIT) family protein